MKTKKSKGNTRELDLDSLGSTAQLNGHSSAVRSLRFVVSILKETLSTLEHPKGTFTSGMLCRKR